MKVAVCDYRAGNIRSVEIALRRLGAEMVDDVAGADLAVLPGVGSARSAMDELRAQGLDEALRIVLDARPDVLNHNTETVPRLYNVARRWRGIT